MVPASTSDLKVEAMRARRSLDKPMISDFGTLIPPGNMQVTHWYCSHAAAFRRGSLPPVFARMGVRRVKLTRDAIPAYNLPATRSDHVIANQRYGPRFHG